MLQNTSFSKRMKFSEATNKFRFKCCTQGDVLNVLGKKDVKNSKNANMNINYTNNNSENIKQDNSENIAQNNSENIEQDSLVSRFFLGIRLYKATVCFSGTEEHSQWLRVLSVKFFIIYSI